MVRIAIGITMRLAVQTQNSTIDLNYTQVFICVIKCCMDEEEKSAQVILKADVWRKVRDRDLNGFFLAEE